MEKREETLLLANDPKYTIQKSLQRFFEIILSLDFVLFYVYAGFLSGEKQGNEVL